MSTIRDRPMSTPPLQIKTSRPSTAPTASETPGSASASASQKYQSPTPASPQQAKPSHQHFVLPDFVAFRYLEADSATQVVERNAELRGYQCYVVEQWATSRSHPTFTITTYTGDPSHSVTVSVLSVPTDELTWSPRLRVYFKALNQFHAQRSESPLGVLMVTNLAGFPSSLTLISVPGGDLRKCKNNFFVNENLKRLGCSGRVGLTLAPPSGATVAKFQQLYLTSDKNDVYQSVVGLVKICQQALVLFNKIEIDYTDGLLCDITEGAINKWWRDIGSYFYNVEPHDGILGPTTVAGLLGLLMGARNRLHSTNVPVSKDALDIEAMKRGIGAFQKQQRLPRSRRLDRRTLERLHQQTQRHAEHSGWGVPKAVKSTVAELSGKGGEMVMEAVGRRDRAGIAEIETCDMERVVQLAYGEKPRWMWYGKPLKKSRDDIIGGLDAEGGDDPELTKAVSFRENEHGGFSWSGRKGAFEDIASTKRTASDDMRPTSVDEDVDDTSTRTKRITKTATSGSLEIKAGMNRLRDAVGFRGNHDLRNRQKASKDELVTPPRSPVSGDNGRQRRPLMQRAQTSPSHHESPRSATTDDRPETRLSTPQNPMARFQFPMGIDERMAPPRPLTGDNSSVVAEESPRPSFSATEKQESGDSDHRHEIAELEREHPSEDTGTGPSVEGSVYDDGEANGQPQAEAETKEDANKLLRRTVSLDRSFDPGIHPRTDDSYPRHLSFSLAESSILTWRLISDETTPSANGHLPHRSLRTQLASEEFFAQEATTFRSLLDELSTTIVPWTDSQLAGLHTFVERAEQYHVEFEEMYRPRAERVQDMHVSSETVTRAQRERFDETCKEIETLVAKLEYEIDGLRGRIEDAGAGVQDFRKGVVRVEERVGELEKDLETDRGSWGCGVM